MSTAEFQNTKWQVCPHCKGNGVARQRIRKKAKLQYQKELEAFRTSEQKGNPTTSPPTLPRGHLLSCKYCSGSGLIRQQADSENSKKKEISNNASPYPHIAIIGGGIGGVALAVACYHRKIPFTLYERDRNFSERSQGYGLTLQQASKALKGFGIDKLKNGVVSNRHLVHDTEGNVLGEWGMRKWLENANTKKPKNTNIHIARQSLRQALLEQLPKENNIKWGYRFTGLAINNDQSVRIDFEIDGKNIHTTTDIVVGADGIRSKVRPFLIPENKTPLRYLDCMVILGICALKDIVGNHNNLLDNATVFQTANGNDRMYMMPYDDQSVMWQFSFPVTESEAKKLSETGSEALKQESQKRASWHQPIPEILEATPTELISGYPVYDRPLWTKKKLADTAPITLMGDAAHPMSPFKGQGANQALLDALALARTIYQFGNTNAKPHWKDIGIRAKILNRYEYEMLERSAVKVTDSAKAATLLHSKKVLEKKNKPRGK